MVLRGCELDGDEEDDDGDHDDDEDDDGWLHGSEGISICI